MVVLQCVPPLCCHGKRFCPATLKGIILNLQHGSFSLYLNSSPTFRGCTLLRPAHVLVVLAAAADVVGYPDLDHLQGSPHTGLVLGADGHTSI